MMKKNVVSALLMGLVMFGLVFVSCDNGTTGGDDNGDYNYVDVPLPAVSGANAVSGRTYYEDWEKTVFSVTAEGAASGTYSVYDLANGIYESDDKFEYIETETGTYAWNESAKTVTLKPEKIALGRGGIGSSFGGTVEVDMEFGPLENRDAYRSRFQAMMNEEFEGMSQAEINAEVASWGGDFSSLADYVNYVVNEYFGNRTYGYSFSDDKASLFFAEALPANKGTNQLSGQTYYGLDWDYDENDEGYTVKDEDKKYVFAASGNTYTYTESYNGTVYEHDTITGSYAYDSSKKRVWLSVDTIGGKNRAAYYAEITVPAEHHYVDDNAYRAVETHEYFDWSVEMDTPYNSTNKTIGWEREK